MKNIKTETFYDENIVRRITTFYVKRIESDVFGIECHVNDDLHVFINTKYAIKALGALCNAYSFNNADLIDTSTGEILEEGLEIGLDANYNLYFELTKEERIYNKRLPSCADARAINALIDEILERNLTHKGFMDIMVQYCKEGNINEEHFYKSVFKMYANKIENEK